MSQGSAPHDAVVKWDPNAPCAERYIKAMKSDGTFIMLSELKRTGAIDDALVFYESYREPGFANWGRGITGHVCPQIDWVRQFINEETVIYVRGGFRGWFKLLNDYKTKNWLICYNANTGRERWTFWDIILWDLADCNIIDRHERVWYYYKKPIDEKTFYHILQDRSFDVCIGASHIHDKKGQWRGINALIEYKRKYGRNLKAVLPGYGNKGTQTSQIITKIKDNGLDVTCMGMLNRDNLCRVVFNRTKLGLFLGTHGQGDRGPIEALATGLPLIIGSERYHSPSVLDPRVTLIPDKLNDFEHIADCIRSRLSHLPSRESVVQCYRENMGFKEVCYPNIKYVFDFIKRNPEPSRQAKLRFIDERSS